MVILAFNRVKKQIGRNFTLEIEKMEVLEGETLVLLGPNGAGKTTTLKLATNLLKPDTGEITFLNKNLNKEFEKIKEYIGYVPDEVTLYDFLKVEEFINFLLESNRLEPDFIKERIDYLNSKLFILDYRNYLIKDLSLGTKQRIGIFTAMLKKPKILVVDEPLVGLDPYFTSKVKELFVEYTTKDKGCILMSTHLLNVAEELSTKICMILNGKIYYSGTIQDLKMKYNTNISLEALFLKIVDSKS